MPKQSPKVLFNVSQNYSSDASPQATVPYFVGFFSKGPAHDVLVDFKGFISTFGEPDPLKYGIPSLYPYLFLKKTKGVALVRRALHTEDNSSDLVATYAGATVRWVTDGVEDPVVNPISGGITLGEFDKFTFPTSTDNRLIFKKSSSKIFEVSTDASELRLTDTDSLLDSHDIISILPNGSVPDSSVDTYQIINRDEKTIVKDYLKLDRTLGADIVKDSLVHEVFRNMLRGYLLLTGVTLEPQTVSGSHLDVNDVTAFKVGDVLTFPGLPQTATIHEYTVTRVKKIGISIKGTSLDRTVISGSQPIFIKRTSDVDGDVLVIPVNSGKPVFPRVDTTNSDTLELPSALNIAQGDVLYLTADSVINGTPSTVTTVAPATTGNFSTVTVDTTQSLFGINNLDKAFPIVFVKPGLISVETKEIISPVTKKNVVIVEDASSTENNVVVDDNDNLNRDMQIVIEPAGTPVGTAPSGTVYVVSDKKDLTYKYTSVMLDRDYSGTISNGSEIFLKVNKSIMEKDAFLVTALSPGEYGNSLSVKISENDQREGLFFLTVVENGIEVEGPFVCSRIKDAVDSYKNSVYIEDVINSNSHYIRVQDNLEAVNPATGVPYKPLMTDHMLIKPFPSSVLGHLNTTVHEKVFTGDSTVKVIGAHSADIAKWSVGDTMYFTDSKGVNYSYSVSRVNIVPSVPRIAVIEIRGVFSENHLPGESVDRLEGFKTEPSLSIEGVDISLNIGDVYTYKGVKHTVVDSGANKLKHGQDGIIGAEDDFIKAFDSVTNMSKHPQELLISDGGFATPNIYSAIASMAKTRERCMFYGSVVKLPNGLSESDYVEKCGDYADSVMVTDKYSSIFSEYSKAKYATKSYWISDHLFNIINQYLNTLKGEGVLPAANDAGKIDGIIDKDIELGIDYQDILESKQINYSRKVGGGYTCMSNSTRYNIDSYFQFRHIIHYINAIHGIVQGVFEPYLWKTVTQNDVDNVDTSIGNLLSRDLGKLTQSYEMESDFLSNGDGTTTWLYKLWVQPKDVVTKILFHLTVTNGKLSIKLKG